MDPPSNTNTTTTPSTAANSAFFYGTLMAPSVLHRVTNRTAATTTPTKPALHIRPALLPGFRRHRVKHCDYPAVVPAGADAAHTSEVRGTYVAGLTRDDMRRLDAFEGGEYERRVVRVRVLAEIAATGGAQDAHEAEEVQAQTYVWIADRDDLEDEEWDFDHFVKEKLWRWAGGTSGDRGFEDAAAVQLEDDGEAVDATRGRSVNGGEFEKKMLGL